MSIITEYIAQQEESKQATLQMIYDTVHEHVPTVEDGWKYGISTFIYKDKPILGFAATKTGISIYPYGNSTIEPLLKEEIAPYASGGGTLSFKTGVCIPQELVAKIATVRKAFIEENLKK